MAGKRDNRVLVLYVQSLDTEYIVYDVRWAGEQDEVSQHAKWDGGRCGQHCLLQYFSVELAFAPVIAQPTRDVLPVCAARATKARS